MQRVATYEDTIYNNPFEQPWDRDPDYLAEIQTWYERWRTLHRAIEDCEFFADGAPLPADLVTQRALAQAERRNIVFRHFLHHYKVAVASGEPLNLYQQQYQDETMG